jgi:hypothetical protein
LHKPVFYATPENNYKAEMISMEEFFGLRTIQQQAPVGERVKRETLGISCVYFDIKN